MLDQLEPGLVSLQSTNHARVTDMLADCGAMAGHGTAMPGVTWNRTVAEGGPMSTSFSESETAIRFLDKQLDAIRAVLDEFPADAIWSRPSTGVVSLGNLVCHVAGSMRDWFENGLAAGDWVRDRQLEFDRDTGPDRAGLHAMLDETRTLCTAFLAEVCETNWEDDRQFRGRTLPVREVLWHQVEHVAYHAGQAALLRRLTGRLPARP